MLWVIVDNISQNHNIESFTGNRKMRGNFVNSISPAIPFHFEWCALWDQRCNAVCIELQIVDEIWIWIVRYNSRSWSFDRRDQTGQSGACTKLKYISALDKLFCSILKTVSYCAACIP